MYLQILLVYFIIVYLILKNKKSTILLKISFWLCLAFSFLILTHLFSGISYYVGDIYRVMPYLFLCLVLVILGEMRGSKIKTSNAKTIPIKIKTLNLISLFGSVILIADMFRMNQITFGLRIEDQNSSILGVIGAVLASLGIISWMSSFYENRINKRKIPFLSYISILSYISGGILSAGRQSIIIITISTLILFIWSYKKNKEIVEINSAEIIGKQKIPWGMLVIALTFFCYFFFISAVRQQIFNINDKVVALEKSFNAKISHNTLKQIYITGPFSDLYLESLFYYSHELIHLDLLYQNYDYPPLLGLVQLPYIERRLEWLFGKQSELSWKEEQRAVEVKGGFSSHTWGTFITNFITDFGRFGALFACFIMGFISGIFFNKVRDDVNPISIVRQCLICAGIVFSIQFSPFVELTYAFPLIMSSFIKVVPTKV